MVVAGTVRSRTAAAARTRLIFRLKPDATVSANAFFI
jgi:hypothetical protein